MLTITYTVYQDDGRLLSLELVVDRRYLNNRNTLLLMRCTHFFVHHTQPSVRASLLLYTIHKIYAYSCKYYYIDILDHSMEVIYIEV